MKKRATVIIALGIVLLLFVSCSTTGRHLYYHQDQETAEKSTSVEGSLPLVSIQLSGRTLNWSEGGGNYITNYTFNFDNANAFADMVFDYLPLRDLGVSIPATLRRGDVRLTEYIDYMARIRNESYAWGVKVVDAKGDPSRMDPNILTCLNENVDAGQQVRSPVLLRRPGNRARAGQRANRGGPGKTERGAA